MKFEYRILISDEIARLASNGSHFLEGLNSLGDDGWELISIMDCHGIYRYYFKRGKENG